MSEHPFLEGAAIGAAVGLNDAHNKKMLERGEYIPWWKRHLLLLIILGLTVGPLLVVGLWLGVVIGLGALAGASGWAFTILMLGVISWIVVGGYRHGERRWRRDANKPTKVVVVRRP